MEDRPISEHLHFAIATGDIDKVQQLLSIGANANSRMLVDEESLETVSRRSVSSYNSLRASVNSLKKLQTSSFTEASADKTSIKDIDETRQQNTEPTICEADCEAKKDGYDSGYDNEGECTHNETEDSESDRQSVVATPKPTEAEEISSKETEITDDNQQDITEITVDNQENITEMLNDNEQDITEKMDDNEQSITEILDDNQQDITEILNNLEKEITSAEIRMREKAETSNEPVKRTSLFKIIKIEQKSRSNTEDSLLSDDMNNENKRKSLPDLIDERLNDNNKILVEKRASIQPVNESDDDDDDDHRFGYSQSKDEKEKLVPRLKKKISFKFGQKKNIKKSSENIAYDSEDFYENYGPRNVDNEQLNENFEGVAFFEAVKEGMGIIVQTLLETSQLCQLNMMDNDGFTPVMQAAWHGQAECLQILLDHCADTSLQNATGCTAAHFAAGEGHTKCLEILANDQLVDINCQSKFGATPLMLAARSGHHEAVELLLNYGADPNIQYRGNQNALLFAAGNGHYECIAALIEKGVKLDQANTQNVTPLMRAAQQGHNGCVTLLTDKGADLDIQDAYGRTAAHFAVENHNPKGLQILLNAGADVKLTTKSGNTPFNYAERFRDSACAKLLEKHSDKTGCEKKESACAAEPIQYKECSLYEPKEKTVTCMKLRYLFRRSKKKRR